MSESISSSLVLAITVLNHYLIHSGPATWFLVPSAKWKDGAPCLKLYRIPRYRQKTLSHIWGPSKRRALCNCTLHAHEAGSASIPPNSPYQVMYTETVTLKLSPAGPPLPVKQVLTAQLSGCSCQRLRELHPLKLCGMWAAYSCVPALNTSYANGTLLYFSRVYLSHLPKNEKWFCWFSNSVTFPSFPLWSLKRVVSIY